MSVLIKGMTMPTSCSECFVNFCKGRAKNKRLMVQRGEDCPLVPISPHGRLIDVDAPMRFEIKIDGGMNMCVTDIYAPTVIEAEDHIGDANEMVGDSE